MATDIVDLWNMALSLAQETGSVSDPAENKRSTNLCRLWYDQARRRVLKAGYFPCATTYKRLALLEERGDDDTWSEGNAVPGRCFLYSEPVGLLAPQYLTTYAGFERLYQNSNKVIATNQTQAVLRYTFDQEDTSTWDEGLVLAVATFHASLMTRNINGKLGLSDRLRSEAQDAAIMASTEIANESDMLHEALPEAFIARGYTGEISPTRFFYPKEDLNGAVQ